MSAEKKKKHPKELRINQIYLFCILSVSLGFLFGFVLFRKTDGNIIFLLYPPLCIFISWMLVFEEIKDGVNKQNRLKTKEIYLNFFENFYYLSAYENSYKEGLIKAVSSLPSCSLKEKLTDFIGSSEGQEALPFEADVLLREEEIIEQFSILYYSKEEFSKEDTKTFHSLLKDARKEQNSLPF